MIPDMKIAGPRRPLANGRADMANREDGPEDVTLGDIFDVLRRRKLTIAGVTLGFILVGILLGRMAKPQYEGAATIQVARIGVSQGDAVFFRLVETTSQAAARIHGRQFGTAVLKGVDVDPGSHEGKLFFNSLKAQAVPQTDFVEIGLRSVSVQRTRQLIEAIALALGNIHHDVLTREEGRYNVRLQAIDRELDALRNIDAKERQAIRLGKSSSAFALRAFANVQRAQLRLALERERLSIGQLVGSMRSQSRTGVVDMFVDEDPIGRPGIVLVVIGSALLGIFVAVIAVLLFRSRV